MKKMELYKTIWIIVGAVGTVMVALSAYFVPMYSKKIKEKEKTETTLQSVKTNTASPTISVQGNDNKVESNNSSNTDNSSNKSGNSIVGNVNGNVTQSQNTAQNQTGIYMNECSDFKLNNITITQNNAGTDKVIRETVLHEIDKADYLKNFPNKEERIDVCYVYKEDNSESYAHLIYDFLQKSGYKNVNWLGYGETDKNFRGVEIYKEPHRSTIAVGTLRLMKD